MLSGGLFEAARKPERRVVDRPAVYTSAPKCCLSLVYRY